MNKYVGLGFVVTASLTASTAAVFAGAWTLPTGEGQVIVTGTPSEGVQAFDENGKLQPFPRYSKDELQALTEYGATDWLTMILTPMLQHVSVAAPYEGQRTGLGYTDFGGRVRLWHDDSWVVAVQTIFRMPGTFDHTSTAAIGYYDPEVDTRALVGYGFKAGTYPAFINVEVAQRLRFGGPPDEFRADVTFGIQPMDKWLVLLQSFNVVSEGHGYWGIPSYDYEKVQLSGVYALTSSLSLQLGAFRTYAGRNALQENGLVLSAWYKF
jgi:protein XagA